MSTQLLAIETAFLRQSEVASALNLNEIRSLQRTIQNGQKKKFDQSLALSQHVRKAFEWFSSDEGKAKLSEEGISWTSEQFAQKVFGWQKSFFYKLVKASNVPSEVVETFKTKCDELERQGGEPVRSIESLLKFARANEEANNEGAEGEEGGTEANEVESRPQTIFTLTFKHPDGNISVRIDEAGQMKTTNNTTELLSAIKFLQHSIVDAVGRENIEGCRECGGIYE
jgi:hypothetical protein